MMKTTSTRSVMTVLFFGYLLISLCFSAPANSAVNPSSFSSIISQLPIINQLFLASLLNLDATVDVTVFGFASSVVSAIGKATNPTITANIAASVSLLNVINICVKLNALISANPSFGTIINANADAYVSVLNNFLNGVSPVNVNIRAILDVRTLPNFAACLTAAGVANVASIINLALCINISLIFNQLFCQVIQGLVPALAAVLANVLSLVENLLCTIGGLVNNILYTVIGLLGGVTTTLVAILDGLVFPTLFQLTGVVFPIVSQLLGNDLLSKLLPFPGSTFPIPSTALAPAFPLFSLLNAIH